jgi:hypothetical protein
MKRISQLASAAVFALAFAATSGAQAATNPATLFACYVPSSGTVYRISPDGSIPDLKKDCTGASHVKFSWSEQGPQGPRGEVGPQGPPGPPGPSTGGAFSPVRVTQTVTFTNTQRYITVPIPCPAGKKVITGGVIASASGPAGSFTNSSHQGTPADDLSAWLYYYYDQNFGAPGDSQKIFALCA